MSHALGVAVMVVINRFLCEVPLLIIFVQPGCVIYYDYSLCIPIIQRVVQASKMAMVLLRLVPGPPCGPGPSEGAVRGHASCGGEAGDWEDQTGVARGGVGVGAGTGVDARGVAPRMRYRHVRGYVRTIRAQNITGTQTEDAKCAADRTFSVNNAQV